MAYPTPNYKNMQAASGAHVPFYFVIQKADQVPTEVTTWTPAGFKRGFETSDSMDSIDITGDTDFGAGAYKKSMSTWVESTSSVDFIARGDKDAQGDLTADAAGQKTLWTHLKSPGSVTDNERVFWALWFHPVFDKQIVQCFTATSVSDAMAYDDAVTFTCDLTAKGAPLMTDIPSA